MDTENKYNEIPMIIQPEELKIDLHPHQLASVYKMETLERDHTVYYDFTNNEENIIRTSLGINGNITGYGKTLEMITLILRDKMEWDVNDPYIKSETIPIANGLVNKVTLKKYEKNNTTLILANRSIIKQWLNEFKHTNLKVFSVMNNKDIECVDPDKYDVIIINSTFFNRMMQRFRNVCWKRFIFDEPGHIKVPRMQPVYAGFMWLVTATPYAICTQHKHCSTSFMYSISRSLYDWNHITKNIIVSHPEDFIKQSFQMPPTKHIYHKCYSALYKAFNGMIDDRIMDMIQGDDIESAIQALGGNKTTNITELIKQKKNEELLQIRYKIQLYNNRQNEESKVNEWKRREIAIVKQIEELDSRFENILKTDCNICFSDLSNPVLEPHCNNVFCTKCLLTWLKNKDNCPLCRAQIKPHELVYIVDQIENKKEEKKPPTKEKAVIDILKKDGKFIFFSSYDKSFTKTKTLLQKYNITFCEIKGNVKCIEKNLDRFKNGELKVIFLNSRFYGAGLNLQEATDIIIYHNMDEALQQQVIGRANRIGRKIPLKVHHLILT